VSMWKLISRCIASSRLRRVDFCRPFFIAAPSKLVE
jgi:hypothetical protein